jgi:AAA domain/UvrD-like helicase C-terminal domain
MRNAGHSQVSVLIRDIRSSRGRADGVRSTILVPHGLLRLANYATLSYALRAPKPPAHPPAGLAHARTDIREQGTLSRGITLRRSWIGREAWVRAGIEGDVTEFRSQKKAIRRRMSETGEKFTQARRAVVASEAAVGPVAASAGNLPAPKGKQKEVLAVPGEGHTVVLGTAGSGKTTMAIHRAAILANPATSHAGKVLLVTFNRTLVAYLNYWRPPALGDVTIENYHAFARGYLASRGQLGSDAICSAEEMASLVSRAVGEVASRGDAKHAPMLEKPVQFFVDEIRFLERYGLTPDEYIASDRFGRGAGFPRDLRPALLDVRDEYLNLRAASGRTYDWDDIAGAALGELEKDDGPRLYRHVVIDEGQDFSPQMLKSLAAAIPDDGSLTFFGDMAQQIYGRQFSWRRAGLHVPHGVWEFQRNYRNTPEIADLGLAIAAMPYYKGVPDMVEPDEFEPSGPPPSLALFDSVQDETKFVIESARAAAQTGSVGVLMRRHQDEARFRKPFRGGQNLNKYMRMWDPGPGISWGTFHAAKGYEFDTVIMVGLSDASWPEPQIVRAQGAEVAATIDGPLLYVGVTRARRELIMTSVGAQTSLLPENNGLWQEQTP